MCTQSLKGQLKRLQSRLKKQKMALRIILNVCKTICEYQPRVLGRVGKLHLMPKHQGWYSQNILRYTYDHPLGRAVLTTKKLS